MGNWKQTANPHQLFSGGRLAELHQTDLIIGNAKGLRLYTQSSRNGASDFNLPFQFL